MGKELKIVIIGGSACGPKAAARARRCAPDARITILEEGQYISIATCGMPYYISGVINPEKKLIVRQPVDFKRTMDIDVLTGMRALSINRPAHRVLSLNIKNGESVSFEYDKLVIATGGSPKVPPFLGRELGNVFTLSKFEDSLALRRAIAPGKLKRAVIIGAGLIGMEMAEAFTRGGLETTVVESLNWPLPALLDQEIGLHLARYIRSQGVRLLFGERVSGFAGDAAGNVKQVLMTGKAIDADIVLMAIGTAPNVKLAAEAGLKIGPLGGIDVNRYLETSDGDIFAGGDCVENLNLVTGNKLLAPMGSTANKHGRVIGTNITGGRDTFPGVMGTGVVKIFDYNVGRTGLNESQVTGNLDPVTALIPVADRASYYPGSQELLVKLIADRTTGRILGGQIIGAGEVAKRIDALVAAISFGATVEKLADLDLAYAPPYNGAFDPLHHAANVIRNKITGLARAVTPLELKGMMDKGDDFILLDVRNPDEVDKSRIEYRRTVYIPLPELRSNLGQLPKQANIVIICRSSVRAYQALRVLGGAGYPNIRFLDGSLLGWPFEVNTTPIH